jgi:hypothetical protein
MVFTFQLNGYSKTLAIFNALKLEACGSKLNASLNHINRKERKVYAKALYSARSS